MPNQLRLLGWAIALSLGLFGSQGCKSRSSKATESEPTVDHKETGSQGDTAKPGVSESTRPEIKEVKSNPAPEKERVTVALGQDSFTEDEKLLLAYATKRGSRYKGPPQEEIAPPQLSAKEKKDLLTRVYKKGERGQSVAMGIMMTDTLLNLLEKKNLRDAQEDFLLYPEEMRRRAVRLFELLGGRPLPAPLTKEFQEFSQPFTAWIDRRRKSEAFNYEMYRLISQAIFRTTLEVEKNLMPAYKNQTSLSMQDFQIRQLPGGQMLELVYTGKEPLTNVVMYSLVQQDPKGNRGSQIPLEAIDAFNRTFGATNEQAEDAMSYLEAVEAFERMPKFACLYLPALHPGKDLMFEVGHMERGAILASNISRFAIYSDQGRILMVNTKDFPLKPEPVRQKPMGPVIGEQYSKPYPGKGDKVYVGSVWRGTSSSEEGATRTRVEKKWEIVVTARNATKIEMNAFEIDSQSKRPIRLVGTALPNGSMRIASIGHFVSLLPPGILNDDELIFSASPAGQKSNLRSASLRLKYVPPKEDVDNK